MCFVHSLLPNNSLLLTCPTAIIVLSKHILFFLDTNIYKPSRFLLRKHMISDISHHYYLYIIITKNYQLSIVNSQLLIVNCQLSTLNCQLSIVNSQLSTVNCQLSIVNSQLSTLNCQLSTLNCQLSIVNCQLSTVNCQLSTVNCQLSTVNCQLSTVNCQLSIVFTAAKVQKKKYICKYTSFFVSLPYFFSYLSLIFPLSFTGS